MNSEAVSEETFNVQWIDKNELPFTNEIDPVKIESQGNVCWKSFVLTFWKEFFAIFKEVAQNVGRELCGMFAVDEGIDLKKLIEEKTISEEMRKDGGGKLDVASENLGQIPIPDHNQIYVSVFMLFFVQNELWALNVKSNVM